MSLKDIDIQSALRRLAERRIEVAIAEGKFDNLPGAGAPLELDPMPADENARMMWWALRLMKQNDFTPHEVQWRKALDYLRAQLDRLTDESRLEPVVRQINDLVRRINTLGTNAINAAVVGVELEVERRRLRERVGGANGDSA
jgi:hypothetical protein